jgi:hypothetical protein
MGDWGFLARKTGPSQFFFIGAAHPRAPSASSRPICTSSFALSLRPRREGLRLARRAPAGTHTHLRIESCACSSLLLPAAQMVFYFTAGDGTMLYMGKDKYENEGLIAHGWPEDVWFHVSFWRGKSGVHFSCARRERASPIRVVAAPEARWLGARHPGRAVLRAEALSITSPCFLTPPLPSPLPSHSPSPPSQVDNLSSAHVYARLPKGTTMDSMSDDLIRDCSQLVKANSIEGCKKSSVVVVYTPWSNLKKDGGMDVGQVGFFNERIVRKFVVTERDKDVS